MMQNSIPVFAAAFVPILALLVAIAIDRKRRRATEKPPQQEKLLRPPGYSLAAWLDKIEDSALLGVLSACLLCTVADAGATVAAGFLGAGVSGLGGR